MIASAKKIDYVGKRHNWQGRWAIKDADGVTHFIPVRHHTEPRDPRPPTEAQKNSEAAA